MSKEIIIKLIDYYSTAETEIVKLRDEVTKLLDYRKLKYIQPIKTFLTNVKSIADNIVRKGFVKKNVSIVERITSDKNDFMRTNINNIDELITNLDNKQLTSDEIRIITRDLNKLKASLSSLIQKIDNFLEFMNTNKLDIYTKNDSTLNNALIQAFKIKDIISIDEIINRAVQLYDTKVEEERAAEERAAEERGAEAEERGAQAEESAKAAEQKAQDYELKLSKQLSVPLDSPPLSPPASPPASNYDSDSDSDTGSKSSFKYTDAFVKSNEAAQKTKEYMKKYMEEQLRQLKTTNPNLTPDKFTEEAREIYKRYKQSLKGGRRNQKTKRRQSRRRNQKTKRRQSRRINKKTKRRQGRRSNRKTKRCRHCCKKLQTYKKTFKGGTPPSTQSDESQLSKVLTKYRNIFGYVRFFFINTFKTRDSIEQLRTDLHTNMSNYMIANKLVTLNNESQLNEILIPTLANYSFSLYPSEKQKIIDSSPENKLIEQILQDLTLLLSNMKH